MINCWVAASPSTCFCYAAKTAQYSTNKRWMKRRKRIKREIKVLLSLSVVICCRRPLNEWMEDLQAIGHAAQKNEHEQQRATSERLDFSIAFHSPSHRSRLHNTSPVCSGKTSDMWHYCKFFHFFTLVVLLLILVFTSRISHEYRSLPSNYSLIDVMKFSNREILCEAPMMTMMAQWMAEKLEFERYGASDTCSSFCNVTTNV